MYNVGLDVDSQAYFTTATTIIAIPTAIKIFNWILTIYSSSLQYQTVIYFVLGFLFSFTFGGFTGVILANVIVDTLLHDTYFVVGHFHYVLSLGAVYTVFASFYHILPTVLSTYYNLFYSIFHFITFFISSNLLFFPMHALGILGHSRRVFDCPINFSSFHYISSIAFILVFISLI